MEEASVQRVLPPHSRGQAWSKDACLLMLRLMLEQDCSYKDVETMIGVPHKTAKRIKKRWLKHGKIGVDDVPEPPLGAGSKSLGEAGIAFLKLLVEEYPTFYLREYVEKLVAAGYNLKKTGVAEVFNRLDISHKQVSCVRAT